MDLVKEIVAASRNIRQERKVDPKLVLRASLQTYFPLERAVIESRANVKFAEGVKGVAWPGAGFDLVVELPEVSAEAVAAQRVKLRKENEQLDKVIGSHKSQLSDEKFLAKVPEKVLAGMREKLLGYETQRQKSQEALDALG